MHTVSLRHLKAPCCITLQKAFTTILPAGHHALSLGPSTAPESLLLGPEFPLKLESGFVA